MWLLYTIHKFEKKSGNYVLEEGNEIPRASKSCVHLRIRLLCVMCFINILKKHMLLKTAFILLEHHSVKINVNIFSHKRYVNTYIVGSISILIWVMPCTNDSLLALYIDDHILWLHAQLWGYAHTIHHKSRGSPFMYENNTKELL
jgi:hypothetical protein